MTRVGGQHKWQVKCNSLESKGNLRDTLVSLRATRADEKGEVGSSSILYSNGDDAVAMGNAESLPGRGGIGRERGKGDMARISAVVLSIAESIGAVCREKRGNS